VNPDEERIQMRKRREASKVWRREVVRLLLCLLVFLGLGTKSEARKVRLAIPAVSVTQIAFYIASEKGYYREEDLDFEIIWMSAPVANLALIGGNVEFSSVPTAALTAATRGAPLRIIFSLFTRPMFWIYSRPDIRDIKALRGKKLGVDGIGGAQDLLVRELLRGQGVDPREVTTPTCGVQQNCYAALISGVLDATLVSFPLNFTAQDAGFRELVSFVNQDMIQLTGSIVAREPFLQSDAATAERFVRGTLKGLLYTRNNRSGTISILSRHLKVSEDRAGKIYDLAKPGITLDGTVDEISQRKTLDDVLKIQGIKGTPQPARFFDFSLAQKVNRELKASGWKPDP
jgi:NitT/TauT family transport system substrate-binding protein